MTLARLAMQMAVVLYVGRRLGPAHPAGQYEVLDIRVAVASQGVVSLIVSEKKDDVGPLLRASSPRGKEMADGSNPPRYTPSEKRPLCQTPNHGSEPNPFGQPQLKTVCLRK